MLRAYISIDRVPEGVKKQILTPLLTTLIFFNYQSVRQAGLRLVAIIALNLTIMHKGLKRKERKNTGRPTD